MNGREGTPPLGLAARDWLARSTVKLVLYRYFPSTVSICPWWIRWEGPSKYTQGPRWSWRFGFWTWILEHQALLSYIYYLDWRDQESDCKLTIWLSWLLTADSSDSKQVCLWGFICLADAILTVVVFAGLLACLASLSLANSCFLDLKHVTGVLFFQRRFYFRLPGYRFIVWWHVVEGLGQKDRDKPFYFSIENASGCPPLGV